MKAWHYSASYLIPGLAAIGLVLGGVFAWTTAVFVFLTIPLLDAISGPNAPRNDEESEERARKNRLYSWVLYGHLPVQIGLVLLLGFVWTQQPDTPLWVRAGWVLSVVLSTGGIGITVAHELIHRRSAWERWIGKLLLMIVHYMHFSIEHVRGHHALVATEEDPASAPRGMSVYRLE